MGLNIEASRVNVNHRAQQGVMHAAYGFILCIRQVNVLIPRTIVEQ